MLIPGERKLTTTGTWALYFNQPARYIPGHLTGLAENTESPTPVPLHSGLHTIFFRRAVKCLEIMRSQSRKVLAARTRQHMVSYGVDEKTGRRLILEQHLHCCRLSGTADRGNTCTSSPRLFQRRCRHFSAGSQPRSDP